MYSNHDNYQWNTEKLQWGHYNFQSALYCGSWLMQWVKEWNKTYNDWKIWHIPVYLSHLGNISHPSCSSHMTECWQMECEQIWHTVLTGLANKYVPMISELLSAPVCQPNVEARATLRSSILKTYSFHQPRPLKNSWHRTISTSFFTNCILHNQEIN